jgi:predicted Zn-dependent protease
MAYLHFRLNNQKSFKKQIKAALKINPQSADAYAMLSELWYLKNRDVDETMYFAKKATELKSKNKNVKPILAWVMMQKNRPTEAVAIFEEYYEENPNESFFARSLSQVYSRGGVKEKSKKLAEAANKLEINDSLRSRFIFKDSTPTVNSESFRDDRTRLPASLEND